MNRDEMLCRLARAYAEQEGAALRRELSPEGAQPPTPGLDKKVRAGLFRLKYRVRFRVVGTAVGTLAACLALVLLLPPVLRQPGPGSIAPQPQMAAPAAPAAGALPEAEVFGGLARAEGELDMNIAPSAELHWGFDVHTDRTEPVVLPDLPENAELTVPHALPGCAVPFAAADGRIEFEYDYPMGLELFTPPAFLLPEGFYRIDGFFEVGFYVYRFAHQDYQHQYARLLILPAYPHYDLSRQVEWLLMELGGQTVHYWPYGYEIVIFFERNSLYHEISSGFDWETTLLLAEAVIASEL